MEHYVTLFDGGFLPQGLALHRSLQRHAGAHTLWVLCMDDAAFDVLERLRLPDVRLFRLADAETDALRAAKAGRTRGEYCWTMTPFTFGLVFAADPDAARVTYVDADVWFRDDPAPIFDELERAGKSVLITEHAYAPEFDQAHVNGKYCVQFVTFVRGAGDPVRAWWAERCVEWCFDRDEDGKYGDQKYLTAWPRLFGDRVHVLQKKELVQGPWCLARFPPSDAAVYHFHGLRLMRGGDVLLTYHYSISASAQAALYQPYLRDLAAGLRRLREAGHAARPQLDRSRWRQRLLLARRSVGALWRKLRRRRIGRLPAGDAGELPDRTG